MGTHCIQGSSMRIVLCCMLHVILFVVQPCKSKCITCGWDTVPRQSMISLKIKTAIAKLVYGFVFFFFTCWKLILWTGVNENAVWNVSLNQK